MDRDIVSTLEIATQEKKDEIRSWVDKKMEEDPSNFLYRLAEIYLNSTNDEVRVWCVVIFNYVELHSSFNEMKIHARNILIMLDKLNQEVISTNSLLRSIRYMLSIKSEF